MSLDRAMHAVPEDRPSPRHDNLALRWDAPTGDGRILAHGSEALNLYQSDLADGFGGIDGASMTLGRLVEGGGFVPLIRRAIALPEDDPVGDAEADPVSDVTHATQDRSGAGDGAGI